MKQPEKQFNLFNENRPNVLLLGNGICQAYGGKSWNELLDIIKDSDDFPTAAKKYELPQPLKASMLTNGALTTKLNQIVKEDNGSEKTISWDKFANCTSEQHDFLRKLLSLDFDYILTTNYSYELELALLGNNTAKPSQIAKLMNFTEVDNAQTHFLVNTYNSCKLNGIEKQIWHIHGEARKTSSIIIGHYYYGKLLNKIIGRLEDKNSKYMSNLKNKKPQSFGSWIDAFAWGNVYIMGFGMDFSESDLWWLLEYKKIHNSGSVIYYDPNHNYNSCCVLDSSIQCDKIKDYTRANECKKILLNNSGVNIKSLDFTIHKNEDYKPFYEKVYEDVHKMLNG